jgi:hypothetical protein
MAVPVLTAMRTELVSRLRGDAQLVGLLGGADRVVRRPSVIPPVRPLLTYFDFGTRPDATVPLLDWTVQVDIWDVDVDAAEVIAQRVGELLDNRPFSVDGVLKGVYLQLISDRDEVIGEADQARRIQEYRLLAYDLMART